MTDDLDNYKPGEWFMAHTIDQMQNFYRSRLPAIREAAQACGYAIGVHGSERRDFDLIAVPWREDADAADRLAHKIAKAACGITRDGAYEWEKKPAGRIATSIPVCWAAKWADKMMGVGHIDLSVMQPNTAAQRLPAEPTEIRVEWLLQGLGGGGLWHPATDENRSVLLAAVNDGCRMYGTDTHWIAEREQ